MPTTSVTWDPGLSWHSYRSTCYYICSVLLICPSGRIFLCSSLYRNWSLLETDGATRKKAASKWWALTNGWLIFTPPGRGAFSIFTDSSICSCKAAMQASRTYCFQEKLANQFHQWILLNPNLYNVTWCLIQIHTIFMRFFLPIALWSLTWSTFALRKRSLAKLVWCPPFPLHNLANKNSCLGSI